MKVKLLILAIGILMASCQKDSNATEEYPITYELNFELLRVDGSVYDNGEIQISSIPLSMVDGDLVGDFEWYGMGKIPTEEDQNNDKILFGGPCGVPNCVTDFIPIPFASGAEGSEAEEDQIWETDKYWLLRYVNEDVDTLRIHDVRINNPYTRTFSFFINEEPIEASNFIFHEYAITMPCSSYKLNLFQGKPFNLKAERFFK